MFPINFLVVIRATYLVLKQADGPVSKQICNTRSCWFTNVFLDLQKNCGPGKGDCESLFLSHAGCPYSLLGHSMLHKLKAEMQFVKDEIIPRFGLLLFIRSDNGLLLRLLRTVLLFWGSIANCIALTIYEVQDRRRG